jgi:hypothetical protein
VATTGVVACTSPQPDSPLGRRLDDGSLVVGAGVTDGRNWTATAKVSERSLCLTFVEAGDEELFGCVPLANVREADMTFANEGGRHVSVAGSTDEQVAYVELVSAQGTWRHTVVSLRPLGLAASAYAVKLPAVPRVTEARLLDAAGQILERAY